jgi:hypothetical protein
MRIFTRTGAIGRHQAKKKIAPLSARKDLVDNLRTERKKLSDHNIQDKHEVMREIRKWENALDKGRPETLDVGAKNAMWKRAKELKDRFTIGMLSSDELHPVKMFEKNGTIQTVVNEGKMESIHSVERQRAWEKRNQEYVREFKNIMRHLCPENPSATDIEKFRPKRRIG